METHLYRGATATSARVSTFHLHRSRTALFVLAAVTVAGGFMAPRFAAAASALFHSAPATDEAPVPAAGPIEPAPVEGAALGFACDGDGHDHSDAAPPSKRGRFEALAEVELSPKVEEKLNAIADRYRKRTGKTFIVTSGIRDPDTQAQLIYSKLVAGEDLTKLYKDKSAVGELIKVFGDARAQKKSKSTTITLLASAIRAQMKRGIFISAHLKAGAADVRSSSMGSSEKRAFAEVAKDGGFAVMLEAVPPHFHLQLE